MTQENIQSAARGLDYRPGNALTLFKNGNDGFFPALIAAINAAQFEVRIETYIFECDDTGRQVIAALTSAAQRGVAVRVMIDGIGSKQFPKTARAQLEQAGVLLLVYRPDISPFSFAKSRLRRLHRKVTVIDGVTAFVGGINIVDDFAESHRADPGQPRYPQFDFSVQMRGPVVAPIYQSTLQIWRVLALTQLFTRRGQRDAFTKAALPLQPKPVNDAAGVSDVAFVYRDNFRHRKTIERMYLSATASSQTQIMLANAYFLPGKRLRQLLKKAAKRGVKVTLVLQGLSDHPVLQFATRALYADLLRSGIRIIEYKRSMLHAKVCVVDRSWATVGSSNLDPFSLVLAREANIATTDVAFATKLAELLDYEIGVGGVAYSHERWQNRGLLMRFSSWVAFGFARIALGIVGLGRGY